MLLPRTAVDRGNRELFRLNKNNSNQDERNFMKILTKKIASTHKIAVKKRLSKKNCLPSANFGFGGILAVIVAAFYVILTPKFCVCFALNCCRSFLFTSPWPKINYESWKFQINFFCFVVLDVLKVFSLLDIDTKLCVIKMGKNVVRYSLNATRKPESTENCDFSMVNCQTVMEQCNRCGETHAHYDAQRPGLTKCQHRGGFRCELILDLKIVQNSLALRIWNWFGNE